MRVLPHFEPRLRDALRVLVGADVEGKTVIKLAKDGFWCRRCVAFRCGASPLIDVAFFQLPVRAAGDEADVLDLRVQYAGVFDAAVMYVREKSKPGLRPNLLQCPRGSTRFMMSLDATPKRHSHRMLCDRLEGVRQQGTAGD